MYSLEGEAQGQKGGGADEEGERWWMGGGCYLLTKDEEEWQVVGPGKGGGLHKRPSESKESPFKQTHAVSCKGRWRGANRPKDEHGRLLLSWARWCAPADEGSQPETATHGGQAHWLYLTGSRGA